MEDVAVTKARRIVSQVGGVGGLALELLRGGMANPDVLAGVLAEYPEAGTTMGCIRWYRTQLRLAGEDVPTAVQARQGKWCMRQMPIAA